jgi:hypothetical protein
MGQNAAAATDPFFKPATISGRTIDYYSAYTPRHMVGTTLHPDKTVLRVDYTMALFEFASQTEARDLFQQAKTLLQRDPNKNGDILRESQRGYAGFIAEIKEGMAESGFDREEDRPGLTVSFFCDPLTYGITGSAINLTRATLGGRAHFHSADTMLKYDAPGMRDEYLDLKTWKGFVTAQSGLWTPDTEATGHEPNFQTIDEKMTLLAQRAICQDALDEGVEAILCIDKRDVMKHTPKDLEIKPPRDGYICTTAAKAVKWPKHELRLPCASRGRPVAIVNFALLSAFHQTGRNLIDPLQAERMARFFAQHVVERQGRRRPDARRASSDEALAEFQFGHTTPETAGDRNPVLKVV